jgi:hypothetical protein
MTKIAGQPGRRNAKNVDDNGEDFDLVRAAWMDEAMSKTNNENSGHQQQRPLRWWWIGSVHKEWTVAENKARALMWAILFVLGVTVMFITGRILDGMLGPKHFWSDVVSGTSILFTVGYFSPAICRMFFPSLVSQAEADYLRTMEAMRQRQSKKDSRS